MTAARLTGQTMSARHTWTLLLVVARVRVRHGGERRRLRRATAIQTTPRPDAWIKLCGLSAGCTIDALPHPWLGVHLTLAFIAPTAAEGVTYRCPIQISSQSDPAVSDTIVAIMTTY